MKIKIAVVAAGIVSVSLASAARADFVLANWNFETNTPGDITNNGTGPSVNAEAGVFMGATSVASGLHVSANTDWTTPVGNGSANSLSSNEWAIGDYYQFTTSTTGYSGISISWHQTRSSTGPATFDLLWSTNGTTFTMLVDNYTVPSISWSSVTPDATNTTVFGPHVGPAALDNQTTIYFRLVADSAAGGTAGSNRVDNIVISAAVPAPGAIALLGLAGLVGARRRRR